MIRVGLIFNHAEIIGGGEISFIDLADEIRNFGVEPVGIVERHDEDVALALGQDQVVSGHRVGSPSIPRASRRNRAGGRI